MEKQFHGSSWDFVRLWCAWTFGTPCWATMHPIKQQHIPLNNSASCRVVEHCAKFICNRWLTTIKWLLSTTHNTSQWITMDLYPTHYNETQKCFKIII
jgi:hypothetical protein